MKKTARNLLKWLDLLTSEQQEEYRKLAEAIEEANKD